MLDSSAIERRSHLWTGYRRAIGREGATQGWLGGCFLLGFATPVISFPARCIVDSILGVVVGSYLPRFVHVVKRVFNVLDCFDPPVLYY